MQSHKYVVSSMTMLQDGMEELAERRRGEDIEADWQLRPQQEQSPAPSRRGVYLPQPTYNESAGC